MANKIEEINGKQIVSSSAMGLSSKQFIELKTIGQAKEIKKIEDEITLLSKKDESYDEYLSLALELRDASDALRSPLTTYSTSTTITDAFGARTSSTSCNGCANDISTYLSVQTLTNAPIGSFNINIQSLAVATSMTSNSFPDASITNVVDGGPGHFTAGTFYLINNNSGIPPAPMPITLTAGSILLNVKSAINSQTSQTGVAANIIFISNTQVMLQLTSQTSGIENAFSIYDPNGVLANITWPQSISAADANITFNKIPITRPTNSITDLFGQNGGLIINLLNTNAPSDIITINTSRDNNELSSSIGKFIKAYNDINEFHTKHKIKKNNFAEVGNKKIKVEEFDKKAVLSKENLFTGSVLEIKTILSGTVSGLSTNSMISLGEIGLQFIEKSHTFETHSEESNEKIFHKTKIRNVLGSTDDYAQLFEVLESDPDGFRKIFQMDFNPSSSNLKIASRTNALALTSFTVDIDNTRPFVTVTDANGNVQNMQDIVRIINNNVQLPSGSVNFDPNTGLITGLTNTPIEGLNMLYIGNGIETINVNLSQGFADQLYNYLFELSRVKSTRNEQQINGLRQYDPVTGNALYITDANPGPIKALQLKFASDTKRLGEKESELNEKLSRKTNQLLKEYANTEAKIKTFEEKAAQIRRQEEALNRRN